MCEVVRFLLTMKALKNFGQGFSELLSLGQVCLPAGNLRFDSGAEHLIPADAQPCLDFSPALSDDELWSQLLMPHNRVQAARRSAQGRTPFCSLALGADKTGTKNWRTNGRRLAKVGWVESAATLKRQSFDPLRGLAPPLLFRGRALTKEVCTVSPAGRNSLEGLRVPASIFSRPVCK